MMKRKKLLVLLTGLLVGVSGVTLTEPRKNEAQALEIPQAARVFKAKRKTTPKVILDTGITITTEEFDYLREQSFLPFEINHFTADEIHAYLTTPFTQSVEAGHELLRYDDPETGDHVLKEVPADPNKPAPYYVIDDSYYSRRIVDIPDNYHVVHNSYYPGPGEQWILNRVIYYGDPHFYGEELISYTFSGSMKFSVEYIGAIPYPNVKSYMSFDYVEGGVKKYYHEEHMPWKAPEKLRFTDHGNDGASVLSSYDISYTVRDRFDRNMNTSPLVLQMDVFIEPKVAANYAYTSTSVFAHQRMDIWGPAFDHVDMVPYSPNMLTHVSFPDNPSLPYWDPKVRTEMYLDHA